MTSSSRIVSIIVPCRNEVATIGAFLDSVIAQDTAGMEVEILIADGMSDDGTRELLARRQAAHPRVRLIDNPRRIVSTGLNAGIQAARGDIIIRMDAHTEYAPDYVRRCVETLEATGAANAGGPARTKAVTYLERAIAAAYHSPFSTGGARFHDPDYEGPVDTVTYGAWRRSIFDTLGLFDEDLVRNQDDEFNLRTTRAGMTVWQSPRIVSWYRPRGSLSALFRQYFQYGYWKVAVIRKHKIPASVRHLMPGAFILLLVALLFTAGAGEIFLWTSVASSAALLALLLAGCYLAALFVASSATALKSGFALLPILPLVFATYHFSYGAGFLRGLSRGRPRSSVESAAGDAFTRLSR